MTTSTSKTGAERGTGRSVASQLARGGAAIVVNDLGAAAVVGFASKYLPSSQ